MPGISWECASGPHTTCADGSCRCRCHLTSAELTQDRVKSAMLPTPPNDAQVTTQYPAPSNGTAMICSKCGSYPAKDGDRFCRKDGAAMVSPSPHCGHCGTETGSEPYCGGCGQPTSNEIGFGTLARPPYSAGT